MSVLTRELVGRVLAGDREAQTLFVETLTPTIQWSVAKALRQWRVGPATGRSLHQEVEDITQEVFLELFEDDAKTLRRWDPQILSVEGFVTYLARIKTFEIMRSRRSPWREDPRPASELPTPDIELTPEDETLERDELRKVYVCLNAGFTPEDAHLFALFVVRRDPVRKVAAAVGRTVDAIYRWRSRVYAKARECRDKVRGRWRRSLRTSP